MRRDSSNKFKVYRNNKKAELKEINKSLQRALDNQKKEKNRKKKRDYIMKKRRDCIKPYVSCLQCEWNHDCLWGCGQVNDIATADDSSSNSLNDCDLIKNENTIIIKNCKIPILVKDYNNKGILSSNSSQRSNSKRMAFRAIYLEVIKIKKIRRSTKSAVKKNKYCSSKVDRNVLYIILFIIH
jgi:hypothetical protein